MRTRFQQGLDDLRTRLLRMGGLAEQAVDRACQAYIDRDLARCHMVLEGESQINLAEREIDELAFDLLAMQQPMAVDLRFILAVTKINSDLERVGDQAVNIAERVMDLVELPKADLPVDMARMAGAVSAMVRRSLESFIEGKAELAQAVLEMDNVVDRMRDEAFITLERSSGCDPAGSRRTAHRPQSGTSCGSRHQHRGRCDLLGPRGRCPAQRTAGNPVAGNCPRSRHGDLKGLTATVWL
jgi:phosphate transport system protein